MAHLITQVTTECATRLNAIVASATNPVDGTYNFTPMVVYVGKRLLDAELAATTMPAYSVVIGDHGSPEYSGSTRRISFSTLELVIEGRIGIADRQEPYEDALNAVEDIRAALETKTDLSLGGIVSNLSWDNTIMNADPDDKTAFFAVSYAVTLTVLRGNAASIKPDW